MHIETNEAERSALARRFDLSSLERLDATVAVSLSNSDVLAEGRLSAVLVQSCVVTGEPVPATLDEPFQILFRPHPEGAGGEEELEISESDLDVIFYDGALADIGEAVAQTLGLSLDPYPRVPGASAALKDAGVMGEAEAGPFGALAGLKDKLGK